jgi:hypothetical protein
VCLGLASNGFPAVKDLPFRQETSVKYALAPELHDAVFEKVLLDWNGIVYVLTRQGAARLFDSTLALDRSFRPLAGRKPLDLTVHRGQVYYLYPDELLSNGSAGKFQVELPPGKYERVAFAGDGTGLLAGNSGPALVKNNQVVPLVAPSTNAITRVFAWQNDLFVMDGTTIFRLANGRFVPLHRAPDATTLAFRGREMIVGTTNGYYSLNLDTGRQNAPRQNRLPETNVTCLFPVADGLWVGTTRGAFFKSKDGRTDYYASKRWLSSDQVIDIVVEPGGDVLILTASGLNRIQFKMMTLADKAAFYEQKIRQRHMRYGFCSELRLLVPGERSSTEMIDTDNDGTWSNYYLASQAFRSGATGSEEARRNAWETFEALERLESITGIEGFPARTFERKGFKFSDPERWHTSQDDHWEWKGTTSSDEIVAHTFGCSVLWEVAARSAEEKARIARFYDRIIRHILRNNLYLLDADGKPTLWGRWNPEYVNGYPATIGDRRLNSSEIIAMLQFAYRITGTEHYRERAVELLHAQGYLGNILSSVRNIQYTPGIVHQGNAMGVEWNHSDDLLSFVTYWVLHRFALSDELRAQYAAAIRDHWEIERIERCPLWNFIYSTTRAVDFDLQGALWTLRRFPLDLIDWTVTNSQRRDLTRLPENFRRQQTAELLPPSERPIMRWNGNPFTLDGGSDGARELAGDEFLLPYWMARYLRIIE